MAPLAAKAGSFWPGAVSPILRALTYVHTSPRRFATGGLWGPTGRRSEPSVVDRYLLDDLAQNIEHVVTVQSRVYRLTHSLRCITGDARPGKATWTCRLLTASVTWVTTLGRGRSHLSSPQRRAAELPDAITCVPGASVRGDNGL